MSAATKLLLEPLVDFPFDSDASRANALALMLTPMYRPAISGNTPLTLIDAPQSGSGKSLLARVANVLYAGNPDPSIITAPRDEDEWRKRITSALLAGAPIITIDNLTGTLSSGTLCAALTTGTWSDRALGGNTIVRLPQRATWIATGNNVTLAGDMPRRCCWVRLDPKVSRPYQRDGFKHDDLIGWVIGHRGELIAAALTLARAWVSAGRPSGTAPRMGSFEDWAYVLGGVLAVAGVPGFLGNSAEMLEGADEDAPQWEAFLIELAEEMGGGAATFAEIWDTIRSSPRLIDLIPATFDTPFTTDSSGNGVLSAKFRKELVYAFRTRKGTRFGDSQARIERVAAEAGRSKTARWRIFGMPIPAKSAGDAGDAGDVSAQMCGEDQGIDTEGRMGADLDGPPHPPHPSLVLSPELQAIASLPDERARLEAWGEAKGLEVTYLSEAGDRLRMARNTAS